MILKVSWRLEGQKAMKNNDKISQTNLEHQLSINDAENGLLQDRLEEVGCAVLNYTDNGIEIYVFYSESMYNKYLAGADCMMGMGLYNLKEKVNFELIDDDKLVVVQENGCEIAKYKYVTIFKAVIEYRGHDNKKRSLTFKIRRNEYGEGLNYVEHEGESLIFGSINKIKTYLHENYGNYKLADWQLYF